MRDRSDEFSQRVLEKITQTRLSRASFNFNVPSYKECETSVYIRDFLREAEEIYKQFSLIDQKITDATDIQTALLEFSETDDRLFIIYESIKTALYRVSRRINDLDNRLDASKFYGSETELRICNTQLYTLKKKLTSIVSDYYNIQAEYKEKCKDRVKRQAQISGADVTKIDFNTAVEHKTDLFLRTIFPDFNVAHYYMTEIEKRHKDFLKLEASIQELHDLMFDFNLIMRADNALMNRIDKHSQIVSSAARTGLSDVKDYRHDLEIQNSKYYIAYCCCGFVILILLLAGISTFA